MKISIIVAMDEKRGIGKNNDILFKIPDDFKRMREKTSGHPLVMGRKTFASLGRLLPNRTHIVITHNPDSLKNFPYQPHAVVSSVTEGIEIGKKSLGGEEVFIFGGGQIYKETLAQGLVTTMYLTLVKGDYGADTFFPVYDDLGFKKMHEETHTADGYTYTFLDLEKKAQ